MLHNNVDSFNDMHITSSSFFYFGLDFLSTKINTFAETALEQIMFLMFSFFFFLYSLFFETFFMLKKLPLNNSNNNKRCFLSATQTVNKAIEQLC